MAKAKKKEKKRNKWKRGPHLSKLPPRVPVAVVPTIDEIRSSATHAPVRDVALPELWLKIEQPAHVMFLEKMRTDTAPAMPGGRKRPAMLAKVHDYAEGLSPLGVKDLAIPAALAGVFASIPLDGYVGRSYLITRHRRHERKNASGFTVVEMQPTKTGDAG